MIAHFVEVVWHSADLWHAHWVIGRGYFDPRSFWSDWLPRDLKDMLVFVSAPTPYNVSISFPAVADPAEMADAIENCFDGIISSREHRPLSSGDQLDTRDPWVELNEGLDPRVKVNSPWPLIDESTPTSMFGAERDG